MTSTTNYSYAVKALSLFFLLTTIVGCKNDAAKASDDAKSAAPQSSSANAVSSEPSIQIVPANAEIAVGEQLTLTGTLLNKPSSANRWTLSTAWYFGDDKKDIGHPDYKAKDIHVTTAHAWDKPGTYKVTLEYYAGNNVLVESSIDVIVE